MNNILRSAVAVAAVAISAQAAAQVVFYEDESFQGRSFTARSPVRDLERSGFKERASLNKIFLIRAGDTSQRPQKVDLNAAVLPGDILTVEESFF